MSEQTIPIRRPGSQPVIVEEPSKYPTETINLPSQGWFYPETSPLSSGKVELKMMTAKEEDILTNENYQKKNIVFDKLIKSLVVDKSIDTSELLVADLNALLLAARRLGIGDSYNVKIDCSACNNSSTVSIDLSKINYKDCDLSVYPKGVNCFDFDLPVSKRKVQFKILSQKDVEQIHTETTILQKSNPDNSSEMTTRFKHVIISVDGNSDREVIRKFVDTQFLAMDSRALRKRMSEGFPGLDTMFDFVCSNCGHAERMDVPFTVQFFWPED